MYTDGGCRQWLGIAGGGVYIVDQEGNQQKQSLFFKNKTSNEAEFLALIYGLDYIPCPTPHCSDPKSCRRRVSIFSDSKLMVNLVNGKWKAHKKEIIELTQFAQRKLNTCFQWELSWIPRELNEIADSLADEAMDISGVTI